MSLPFMRFICPVKSFVFITLLPAVGIFLAGCGKGEDGQNKPEPQPPRDSVQKKVPDRGDLPKQPTKEDIEKRPADYSLTADAFFAEYKKDRAGSKSKYLGKIIELSGSVQHVDTNYIDLRIENDALGLICGTFLTETWSKIAPSQKVKIKGVLDSTLETPTFIDCVIVEAGSRPALKVTAEELAKEFAGDQKAMETKYRNKFIILTGEIVSKTFKENQLGKVVLKGNKNILISCDMNLAEKRLEKLVVGQPVQVFGFIDFFFCKDDKIAVFDGRLITK